MSAKAVIQDNTPMVKMLIKQHVRSGLRMAGQDMINKAKPNTPRQKGNLSQDVTTSVTGDTASVKWNKVYAQYQERGSRRDGTHVVKRYTTGGTGKGFARKAAMEVGRNPGKYIGKKRGR